MRNRKVTALVLAAMMGTASLCMVAGAEELSVDELTFTYVTSPLNVPSIVEKEQGIFAETLGVPVDYAELTSGADQTQALASGDVQVLYAVGGTSIIQSAAAGADIKVLNMYSRSPKAFCLYTKDEGITSPEDLRGKTIYVNMSIPDAKAALDGDSLDVAMVAGAAAYNCEAAGYHKITDGEGLIKAIIAVAVTEEFYEAHPDVIEKLGEAQDTIADFITNNEEEALQLAADYLDLDLEAVKEMYSYYDFNTEITEEDIDGFQKTADFMYESGMIEEAYDVTALFFD